MRYLIFFMAVLPLFCGGAYAKAQKKEKNWTVRDTVAAAIGYSPAVKSQAESVRMARESVKQARAGHLPKIDVDARTGFGSLPVSKYD